MPEVPDSDLAVRQALEAAAAAQQTELERLLEERARLDAWKSLDAPAEAQRAVEDALARLDGQIGGLLATWSRTGGAVRLEPVGGLAAVPGAPAVSRTPTTTVRREHGRPTVVTRRRAVIPDNGGRFAPAASAGGGYVPRPDTEWRPEFARLMRNLGPGQSLEGERRKLIAASTSCDRWIGWPKYVQRHLVGLLACRMRALQDEHGVPENMLQDGFSALTRFSKTHQPGFVFGLSRNHRPQHGPTWDHDAERHWDQLAALLPDPEAGEPIPAHEKALEQISFLIDGLQDPPSAEAAATVRTQAARAVAEALEVGVEARDPRLVQLALPLEDELEERNFMRLERAVDDALLDAEEYDPEDEDHTVPEHWEWWRWTHGKRAVFIGGDPDPEMMGEMREAFHFESLEWEDGDPEEQLKGLEGRMGNGSVDLIVLLGRHLACEADKLLLPLARQHNVPWVHVDFGQSVALVRRAVERFLEKEGAPSL